MYLVSCHRDKCIYFHLTAAASALVSEEAKRRRAVLLRVAISYTWLTDPAAQETRYFLPLLLIILYFNSPPEVNDRHRTAISSRLIIHCHCPPHVARCRFCSPCIGPIVISQQHDLSTQRHIFILTFRVLDLYRFNWWPSRRRCYSTAADQTSSITSNEYIGPKWSVLATNDQQFVLLT